MAYAAKDYSKIIGMEGFSETLLTNHFTLYQGYVTNTNKVIDLLTAMLKDGKTGTPEYAELKRRFGFEFDGRRYDYFPGYDPSYRKCAPGRLLLTAVMEDCFDRGLRRFDFLRGDEPYKFEWTDTVRPAVRVMVFRPSLGGRLARRLFSARDRRGASAGA